MTKDFKKLKGLVEADINNEVKCRDALVSLLKYFLFNTDLEIEHSEYRNHEGRVDLILITKPVVYQMGAILTFREAIIFELKSPKKRIYEFDSGSRRFLPSYELILAETQLLTYTKSIQENITDLFNKYQVTSVRSGGIIIGREKTKFSIKASQKSSFKNDREIINQQRLTLHSRNDLYGDRIKLFTWDNVLDIIKKNIEM